MSIWQALLIGLWVALVQGRLFGGPVSLNMRFSPLITSLFCGIVLGDIPTAVATGGVIQLITMGQVAPGGQMPTEPAVAAAIAVPLAVVSGLSADAATAVAVPVGILGGYLYQVKQIGNSFPLRYLDKVIDEGDESKYGLAVFVWPMLLSLLIHIPVIFIALYFGADIVADVVAQLDGGIVLHVLEKVGGALGAVGIALLLRIIGRKEYMPFFFLAYILQNVFASLGVSTVTWAVIGVLVAMIYVLIRQEAAKKA
ncbi:PTS mannose/fructose/sorbose/N-acetylgalactosamine transporter subunit IIC [Aerococcus mictus]|uniref:PTS mannose/fructose/sorbose/N-acetylgalactosamine transporter subunit IIC n=1 Tax=Aerococcus mictus TaxID=2976810 RepID=UPI000DCC8182|nr:PTS sugar transporter subunit IIC [Aerococcus mictus]KAA9233770.1 PTS sugar transporter subunit IIC [Aerococcus mictus]MDL5183880.1 PTS sugar transporter subunit IIC [Aerococcus mictus]